MAGAIDLFSGSSSLAGPNLWQIDKNPLNELDQGIEDVIGKQANSAGGQFTLSLQAIINAILGLGLDFLSNPTVEAILGDLQQVEQYFANLLDFLGELNPLDPNFDPIAAIENFITTMLKPTNLIAMLISDATGSAGVTGFIPLENLAMSLIAEAVGGIQELIDAILAALGWAPGTGTLPDITTLFNQLFGMLGGVPNMLTEAWDEVVAVEQFITGMLKPTNLIAMLIADATGSAGVSGFIPLENLAMDLIQEAVGGAQSLIDAILAGLGFPPGSGTTDTIDQLFTNLYAFLGNPDNFAEDIFNDVAAIKNFITAMINPTNLLAPLDPLTSLLFPGNVPGLDASKIITGIFGTGQIPNLDASKIVTGILNALQIPGLDATKIISGVFTVPQIPNLDASKIVTGVFNALQVPGLDATKIVSGIFGTGLIPGLDATKIISGQFQQWLLPLIPVGSVGNITPNMLANPTYATAASVNDVTGAWTWDSTVTHTADGTGSVKVIANGTLKQLLSDPPTPVANTHILSCSHWVEWSGASGTGACYKLSVIAYLAGALVSTTDLQTISSPAASSGWVQLSGSYTVPSNVDSVRLQLTLLPAATAGTLHWDDGSITKTNLFDQGFTSGLVGSLSNLNTAVLARALQTDLISLVNNLGLGSFASIGAALGPITTRLGNLGSGGLFDASQLGNILNIPLLPAVSIPGLDASKIITGALNILQIPTSQLTHLNIPDLGSVIDGITNNFGGTTVNGSGFTQAIANSAMFGIFNSVVQNGQAIQGLMQNTTGNNNSGTFDAVNFNGLPNSGTLPSVFTTTYSGTGTSSIGINGGVAHWTAAGNGNRTGIFIYNVEDTDSDYQRLGATVSSGPGFSGGQSGANYLVARASSLSNPQNYVYAKFTTNGILGYFAELGCVVAGARTIFKAATSMPVNTTIWLLAGVGGNPRRYQVLSGTTPVIDYTETGTTSQFGAGFRKWGFMGDVVGGGNAAPGDGSAVSAADNVPPTVKGSSFRAYRTGGTVNVPTGSAALATNFFDTQDFCSGDMQFNTANATLTIGIEGTYLVNVRYNVNNIPGGAKMNPSLSKNGQIIRQMGGAFADGSFSANSANGAEGLALVYCLAGDTLTPGTVASTAMSNCLTGDATGTSCYFEVALMNLSYN